MRSKVLLVLKEQPSFEGDLSISLTEEHDSGGRERYFLTCQKKPPLNAVEFAIFALKTVVGKDLEDITKSIDWQREVPPKEAKKIISTLEHQVISVAPESDHGGLDGTTYELLIERGFNRIHFKWWVEPPAAWRTLRELLSTLLDLADAASRIETLQSNRRKRLIHELQEELEEERERLNKERTKFIETSNSRCHELAQRLSKAGLKCPNCRVVSSDIRFIDKSPGGRSYFICKACGRSFRPEDL